MDKISAAYAMEWSIQLDKALRSNNPARAVEAIVQTGQRLELWGQEPEATKAVCSIFGLVPGEDRLFANTILLRLADAFRFGDKKIRLSVVRMFLTNTRYDRSKKHRKKKRRTFLSSRVYNHEELLRRVKTVFDTGDVESRAMALVLFGCWADFAKDSAEIRYLVLSTMVSSNILEVKASFFAASRFCELTDDFASVVLEMLVNMMASPETLGAVRLAGASVFTRMGCTYTVSRRAYKTGVKLVSDSSEENFIIAMLVSLSKLVSKSTSLISEQVDVLLRCVTQENSRQMRVTALRCLHLIFVKEGCCSPVNMHVIKALFNILDEPELPSVMHCGALQILHKILLYTLPGLPSFEKLESARLLAILENASQSPIMSKSLAALRILTDMSTKLWARTNSESFAVHSSPLPLQVISLVMAQVRSLVKPSSDPCQTRNRIFQEVKSLLNLVLQLVGEHPDLGVTVLGEISSFIKYFANLNENVLASKQIASGEVIDFEEDMCKAFRSKLLSSIHGFMADCLQILNEAGAITITVFDKVQLLVEHLHHGRVFDYYTCTVYSLLLHSRLVGILIEHPFKQELATLEHACKMLSERDNWHAYKAGVYAASQGAWITATFIFAELIKRVQSDSCHCWLKSLVQFSHSEAKLWLSSLPKQESLLVGSVGMNEIPAFLKDNFGELGKDAAGNDSVPNYRVVLVGAYQNACSSIETLERVVISRKTFCFQRWFFSLRTKFLGAVGKILEVLDTSKQGTFSNIIEVQNNPLTNVKCLEKFTHFSFRLNKLAKEFDLINSSFIGMESESLKVIATLALSCSILAFSAGFPVFFPNLSAHENLRTRDQEDSKQSNLSLMLLQDLLGRLLHIDQEISMDLCLLLESGGCPRKCSHLQSRNCILKSGHEVKDILNITRHAVSTVIRLRSETNRIENEAIISQVTKNGIELLLDIIGKWLRIPFQMPKQFFNTRPFIGSELLVFSTDTRNQNQITVLSGSHLSLNLCLQLRNASPEFSLRLTKLYCLLHSRVSFPTPSHRERNEEEMELNHQPWKSEDMVEMNEKLFRYVTECEKKTSHGKRFRDNDTNNEQIANEFACFEPNAKGQGFSSCVLDVSHFPVGSYRIEWYSCCIDSEGSYWSLLPLNTEPVFTVQQSHVI
ncbi:defective in snRNA processing 1, EMBRYO DEFECTIVE 1895 [Hibiscus trionum]|uniref:Defective in snRNA processing 1, EMBRYO DEFECTIVE 1895 n=1 Tax=Hibiscus trionum TaxID=183268 RepID=A0A9W7J197_HIBTR|nr:defective in snRNA processing 1, EMBRYO DEFECTIVE 1895 [Hibiscus trionum]